MTSPGIARWRSSGPRPVRQVLDSRAVAQVHAIGSTGADRAREFGSQTAGRARDLWRDRRGARADAALDLTDSPAAIRDATDFEI